MRKLLLVLSLLAPGLALAQSATLAVAETVPSRTSIIVGRVYESRADPNDPNTAPIVTVEIWKLTATGARADTLTVSLTGNAELGGFLAAVETPVAGEPAGTTLAIRSRRHNDRILAYLVANCATFATPCPASISGASFVP